MHIYLDRMEQRKKGRKQLGAITSDDNDKEQDVEWSGYYDPHWGWMCTAIPSAKRQRTDEDSDPEKIQSNKLEAHLPSNVRQGDDRVTVRIHVILRECVVVMWLQTTPLADSP